MIALTFTQDIGGNGVGGHLAIFGRDTESGPNLLLPDLSAALLGDGKRGIGWGEGDSE